MTTKAWYHPRNIEVDLARLRGLPWLYSEIVSWHGQIERHGPPILTCLGNGTPLHVVRNHKGRYFARHFKGDSIDGHTHPILGGMSDEHRRQAEYLQRAGDRHGLDAQLEVSTGNGTRLDVAVIGPDGKAGLEVQRSQLSRAKAKRRAFDSYTAGWQTAWISDRETPPDWDGHVPTALMEDRSDTAWAALPPPDTAKVIIGRFKRERDHNARTGWRLYREPTTVLLDELAYLMPAGEIIPVQYGSRNSVGLAHRGAAEIIDSCSYPGAATWKPTAATPRKQEAPQRFSRSCLKHPSPKEVQGQEDWLQENLNPSGDAIDCIVCGLPINPIFRVTAHYDCIRKARP